MPPSAAPLPQTTLDADIFLRLWEQQRLTPTLARHLLKLSFPPADTARISDLTTKNEEGEITPAELNELDEYVRVGLVLSILQSRARKLLRTSTGTRNGRE
jgi:hypothetical protein